MIAASETHLVKPATVSSPIRTTRPGRNAHTVPARPASISAISGGGATSARSGRSGLFGQSNGPEYHSAMRGDLERSYLAALLTGLCDENGAVLLEDCFAICPPGCILDPEARQYFFALRELAGDGARRGLGLGLADLHEMLRILHAAEPEAWPEPEAWKLAGLCESFMGMYGDARRQAALVADMHRLRELRAGLFGLAEEANLYAATPDDIAARARGLADTLCNAALVPDMHELMARVLQRLASDDVDSGGALVPTPWKSLNRVLRGGLQGRELVVLAGRPGTGKTALAGCMAVETARSGRGVLFVSREMGDESLGARMLAREARVDNRFYRERLASGATLEQLRRAADALAPLPLHIAEKGRGQFCPREVRRLALGIRNLGLVVIDYLQLMQPDEYSRSREQDVAAMSRAFKTLAMDLGVPVLLLSQLNRNLEQGDREPYLSDLRESGAIEQDADIVLLLHTRKAERAEKKPTVKCIVGKSRNTGTGAVFLGFDKGVSDFCERRGWAESAQEVRGKAVVNDF